MTHSRTSWLVALLGLAALAACGSDDDILLDNGLGGPPPVGSVGGSSSSSSGASSSGSPTPSSASGDGGASSGAPAEPVEPACNPAANLRPLVALPEFPAGAEWVRLSGDERAAYFSQPQPTGGPKIFSMTRATRGEPFTNLVELGSNVNRTGGSWGPMVRDDDLEIYFLSANIYWKAERASRELPFDSARPVAADLFLLHTRETIADSIAIRSQWRTYREGPFEYQQWNLSASANEITTELGRPALPSWYEASSNRLWVESGTSTSVRRWNGTTWQAGVADPFKVTWTAPSGCRLYGIADGKVQLEERTP